MAYSAEDEEKVQSQAPHTYYPRSSQEIRPPRPILPPAVPSGSSSVSPTLSPHIAAPSITPSAINTSSPQFQKTTIHDLKSTPVETPVSLPNIATTMPPISIIDNVAGEVISMSSEEDEVLWIEVKDELFFNGTQRIMVNPKKTSIISRGGSLSFNDIKIGDIVDVIFDQDDGESVATFISILGRRDRLPSEE